MIVDGHELAEPYDTPVQRAALAALFEHQPRNLTREEYAAVMPPRARRGSLINRRRGWIIRTLNRRGFTVNGKRCS